MKQEEKKKRQRLKDDFRYFAKNALLIRTKDGQLLKFEMNQAQRYIHMRIEKQRREKGRVRAIILKGRQQGCSTYVTGRYYWKIIHRKGIKCFIVTHRDDATSNIYKLVKRYHDNCPAPIKPSTGTANAKELSFDILNSGYGVGTAGSGNIGRSDTVQYLHMSEVAYMQNTQELQTGLMQTVSDMDETEIILESTANGLGNMFHKYCIDAIAEKNEYELIFVPWFWQDEYRLRLPENFKLDEDEEEYKKTYDLDNEQMAWRRNKISFFSDGLKQFRQEYPATIYEAFQNSSTRTVIPSELINKSLSFESQNYMRFCAIIGVDVAREGRDSSIIAVRQGDRIMAVLKFKSQDGHQLAQEIIKVADKFKTKYIFIDAIGVGSSPIDFLKYYKYPCRPVYSGAAAENKLLYANKRAEMWFRIKEAMENGLQIDNDEELVLQLQVQTYDYRLSNQILLKSKDDMKKEGVGSPDKGDAIALTYSYLFNTLDVQGDNIKVINNTSNKVLGD